MWLFSHTAAGFWKSELFQVFGREGRWLDYVCPLAVTQSRSKRARYLRRRSASLPLVLVARDAAKSRRPAALSDALSRQTRDHLRELRLVEEIDAGKAFFGENLVQYVAELAAPAAGPQGLAAVRISSVTVASSMRPLGASVTMRVIEAERSRKLALHSAAGEVAKATKRARASLLKVILAPSSRAWRSSSKSILGSISSRPLLQRRQQEGPQIEPRQEILPRNRP